MWLGHHFQGQKVNLQGAGAYCGGLAHSLLLLLTPQRLWFSTTMALYKFTYLLITGYIRWVAAVLKLNMGDHSLLPKTLVALSSPAYEMLADSPVRVQRNWRTPGDDADAAAVRERTSSSTSISRTSSALGSISCHSAGVSLLLDCCWCCSVHIDHY